MTVGLTVSETGGGQRSCHRPWMYTKWPAAFKLSRNSPERRSATFLNVGMPLRHFLTIQLFFS